MTSFATRSGLEEGDAVTVSRLIRDAVNVGIEDDRSVGFLSSRGGHWSLDTWCTLRYLYGKYA